MPQDLAMLVFFCPLSGLFGTWGTLASEMVTLQNLCDDSLCLGTIAVFLCQVQIFLL